MGSRIDRLGDHLSGDQQRQLPRLAPQGLGHLLALALRVLAGARLDLLRLPAGSLQHFATHAFGRFRGRARLLLRLLAGGGQLALEGGALAFRFLPGALCRLQPVGDPLLAAGQHRLDRLVQEQPQQHHQDDEVGRVGGQPDRRDSERFHVLRIHPGIATPRTGL